MTNRPHTSGRNRRRSRPSGWRRVANGWTLAFVGVVAVGALAVAMTRDASGPTNVQTADSEVGPMGGQVIPTPGQATGTATSGPVTVTGAEWAMGRVPLGVTVKPTWELVNTGTTPVTLGQPRADIVKGCCPGPLDLSDTTIPPGGHATLTFPLQMHPGMDGPHDFRIHIPVIGGEALTVGVTGDFRD